MAQRVGLLNGTNITYDKDLTAGLLALVNGGVIDTGFGVSGSGASANILPGKALVECTRTNGEKVMVFFENTANVGVDLTGTKKVYIQINQGKLDNGSSNALDGTGIGAITTGASYPSTNYIKIGSVTSGVFTDERQYISGKSLERYSIKDMRSIAVGLPNSYFTGADSQNAESGASEVIEFRPANNGNTGQLGITGATSTWFWVKTNCWFDTGTMISQYAYGQNEIWCRSGATDTTWGAWQQIFPLNIATTSSFGGDGSDGLLTGDADITLTGSNNSLVVKNYSGVTKTTSITRAYTNSPTVAPGNNIVFLVSDTSVFSVGRYVRISSSAGVEMSKITAISTNVSITVDKTVLTHTNSSPLITLLRRLTVSSQNNILVLKVKGNCDLSDWYIDLEGKGGAGGNGGTGSGNPGFNGDNGISTLENVGTGGNGGTYNTVTPTQTHKGPSSSIPPFAINYYVQAGSGGGGGSGTQGTPGGGRGGHGGGGLIIECTGTITFPSYNASSTYKNINLNAGATVSGNSPNGGGAGGSAGIYYKTGVSGSISISYLGTVGLVGTYTGYNSGGPNGGSSLYAQGQAGSAINTSTYGTTPQGGAGANGNHILSQVTYL